MCNFLTTDPLTFFRKFRCLCWFYSIDFCGLNPASSHFLITPKTWRGLHTGANQRWKKLLVGPFCITKIIYFPLNGPANSFFQRWFEPVWIELKTGFQIINFSYYGWYAEFLLKIELWFLLGKTTARLNLKIDLITLHTHLA